MDIVGILLLLCLIAVIIAALCIFLVQKWCCSARYDWDEDSPIPAEDDGREMVVLMPLGHAPSARVLANEDEKPPSYERPPSYSTAVDAERLDNAINAVLDSIQAQEAA